MKRVILSLFLTLSLSGLRAQTYKDLYSFRAVSQDGYSPVAGVILGSNVLYGTTLVGGSGSHGTLFRINTDGSAYAVIKSFTNSDGASPEATVVLSGGLLYGTTASGGTAGNGVIFQVNTNGSNYSILKSFPATIPAFEGTNSDGAEPRADLATDGTVLFGTTFSGGTAADGTIFRINADGSGFAVLKSFSATVNLTNDDGANPIAGLVLSGGTLYGTTVYGGVSSNGVVFKIQTNGTGFAVLKYFSGFTNSPGLPLGTNDDGANPRAGLVLSGDTLYGTTVNGGAFSDGVIYKLTTNGTGFNVLRNFSGGDGAQSDNRLLINGSTLYGTAYGGISNNGVVFRADTNGANYSVLQYLNPAGGYYSFSALVADSNHLFGTTYFGGNNLGGAVFSLAVAPQIVVDANLGIRSHIFGFDVVGLSNSVAVAEACANLNNPAWIPVQTNALDGSPDYFGDPTWTNFPDRFYRVKGQ